LKAWRKHLKLTQKEVDKRAGITQSALTQIEHLETNNRTATMENWSRRWGLGPGTWWIDSYTCPHV
jgi:transcriptional regulator with XRE-family HTH domain